MFERFTEGARQVVVLAQEEAKALRHNYIGTEHLLLGLLREGDGLGARVLESLQVEIDDVREQVRRLVGPGDYVKQGQLPFTPRAKKVLELALREALGLDTTTSARSTSCSAPCARTKASRRACCATTVRTSTRSATRSCASSQAAAVRSLRPGCRSTSATRRPADDATAGSSASSTSWGDAEAWQATLNELGAEGWELSWIGDNPPRATFQRRAR